MELCVSALQPCGGGGWLHFPAGEPCTRGRCVSIKHGHPEWKVLLGVSVLLWRRQSPSPQRPCVASPPAVTCFLSRKEVALIEMVSCSQTPVVLSLTAPSEDGHISLSALASNWLWDLWSQGEPLECFSASESSHASVQ